MKTQISRDSFDRTKRYSTVFQQMGRMLTDDDWNILAQMVKERLDDVLRDIIGSGSPARRGILKKQPDGTQVLQWGYAYVDGVVAEVRPDPAGDLVDPKDLIYPGNYDKQIDFPDAPAIPLLVRDYLLYLDVWERSVTVLEDDSLRDPGLHGADTCTRSQTMAQVKWCPVAVNGVKVNPEDPSQNPGKGNALLTLMLRQGNTDLDPCDPCADELKLQERVGNYLFRVEVHDVIYDTKGLPQEVTLKWSSENGAEQYEAADLPPGFASSQWTYELFSFTTEKHLGKHLHNNTNWSPSRANLSSGYPVNLPGDKPFVRRWDGYCVLVRESLSGVWALKNVGSDRGIRLSATNSADAHGHVTEGASVTINLDAITLQLDLQDKQLLAGDFWYAPVREAVDQAGKVLLNNAEPHGILHRYLTLALVNSGSITAVNANSCRQMGFPPLTDLKAEDVCYDNHACQMPNVATVQAALDYLCRQKHECCSIVAEPGEDLQSVFDKLPSNGGAHLCFRPGDYPPLMSTVVINSKGPLKITGAGPATRLVAKGVESVLVFENCVAVSISDIVVATIPFDDDKLDTTANSNGLNGALTFRNCPDVALERVTVECASAARRQRSCLSFFGTSGQPSGVNIQNSRFLVGMQQIGILLVNVGRITLRDNLFTGVASSPALTMPKLLEDKFFRAGTRRLLLAGLVFNPKVPSKEPFTVSLNFGPTAVQFRTHPLVAKHWDALLQAFPTPAAASTSEISKHLKSLVNRVLLEKGRLLGRASGFVEFSKLLLDTGNAGAQGITIGGTLSEEVTIENNTIDGFMQGIHLGLSHGSAPRTPEGANYFRRVVIQNNTLHIKPVPGATTDCQAIFVGNCKSLLIRENYADLQRTLIMENLAVEGIRVFGYLGRMIQIRENHLDGFTIGIRVHRPPGIYKNAKVMWIVADNLTAGAAQPVKAPWPLPVVAMNNIP
jgi:hypothetical protein